MNPMIRLFVKAHVWVYRSSGGRRGASMKGQDVILLTTRGRKTGLKRTVPVVPFFDDGKMYVIASMAGAPQHPAWFLNLSADPHVVVQRGPDCFHARAEVLSDRERNALWPRLAEAMPAFAAYQDKTTRVIPLIRLDRGAAP
ncbi:MAG TPA: nitroreductase/quinone reductase family protein [Polyangiaceae bacterium]|jgi:deazaflavin-dependent oxidoreductase (nitroreductase family)|nr:nitroreductase/quinone reductase family protein [Polyangiaceae bacterium]